MMTIPRPTWTKVVRGSTDHFAKLSAASVHHVDAPEGLTTFRIKGNRTPVWRPSGRALMGLRIIGELKRLRPVGFCKPDGHSLRAPAGCKGDPLPVGREVRTPVDHAGNQERLRLASGLHSPDILIGMR